MQNWQIRDKANYRERVRNKIPYCDDNCKLFWVILMKHLPQCAIYRAAKIAVSIIARGGASPTFSNALSCTIEVH